MRNTDMQRRWWTFGPKIAVMIAAAVVVFGFLVKALWNCLMPSLFGLPTITFWQAFGLFLLSKLLFGGFHGRGFGHNRWHRRMEERLAKMSPEEREQLRHGFRRCWCTHDRQEAQAKPAQS